MSFLPLIPQPTDQLSASQAQILNNFGVLGAIAGNGNAASSSINSTSGFNWLYLPPQGATPPAGAAFPAGNVAFYSFLNPNTAANEIYVNKADASQVPMTAMKNNNAGATNGWTYLPSGLKIAWGTGTIPSGGTLAVVYGSALSSFPGFSTFWTCPQLTRIRTVAGSTTNFVVIQSYNATGFTAKSSTVPISGGGTADFAWMVIGL